VPAGDVEATAEAMQKCLGLGADELATMGQAAKLRIQLRHDNDHEAAKLVTLFRSKCLQK
jgi:colanic acid/amylovoran biosynthesis glycosyltransferase